MAGEKTITRVTLDSKETAEDSTFDLELVTKLVKHSDGTIATQVRRVVYVEKEKGGRPATDGDKKQEALELRSQGMSFRKIGEALGLSKSLIEKWVKEDGE